MFRIWMLSDWQFEREGGQLALTSAVECVECAVVKVLPCEVQTKKSKKDHLLLTLNAHGWNGIRNDK